MQVSDQIIAVLDNLAQKFGIVIDWGQQNVLPYIQQLCEKYIKWEIASSMVWICFGVASAIIGGLIFRHSRRCCEGNERENFTIAAVICWIVALCAIISQTLDIVKCLTFPELQIFEYVKKMLS